MVVTWPLHDVTATVAEHSERKTSTAHPCRLETFVKHWLPLAVAVSAFAIGCSSESSQKGTSGSTATAAAATPTSSTSGADLTGAGATFPQPVYNKWFDEYAAKNNVKINYQ